MVFTPNKNLEQVAHGGDVGTWDTPTNSNWGITDASFGGMAVVPLAAANIVLSAAQYQCAFLTFTGALLANVQVTFPAVGSFYTIQNLTSNTSSFYVTLTNGAGQVIALPPGECIDVFSDTGSAVTGMKYRNLGRIGGYVDIAQPAVPAWIGACTVPPYLNCDGTAFSSGTYPILYAVLGGTTTLPDARGRNRYTLNQGTGRITAAGGGVDGNTLLAAGGSETVTLAKANIPNYALTVTDPTHAHTQNILTWYNTGPGTVQNAAGGSLNQAGGTFTDNAATGITVNSGGSGTPLSEMPPAYVGGLTLIRAA